jgi:nicotinate-nucleotide adenylyltransferase
MPTSKSTDPAHHADESLAHPAEAPLRVALYGGSFNPPHVGHVLTAVWALSIGVVDRVLVVPTFRHAFAKDLASFDDRMEMCRLSMGFLPGVIISPIEAEIGGESRTLVTLRRLAETHPGWQMRLLIGADILRETDKWQAFDEVVKLAPLLVVGRLGFTGADVPPPQLPEVSSTFVRSTIGQARTRDLNRVVPHRVLDYIEAHGLYRDTARVPAPERQPGPEASDS